LTAGWFRLLAQNWDLRYDGDSFPITAMPLPEHQAQEIPIDHADSTCMFQPGPEKPFVATPAAIDAFSHEVIIECLRVLRHKADVSQGLDYLQVFQAEDGSKLWFIEDGPGGAITALTPSDY